MPVALPNGSALFKIYQTVSSGNTDKTAEPLSLCVNIPPLPRRIATEHCHQSPGCLLLLLLRHCKTISMSMKSASRRFLVCFRPVELDSGDLYGGDGVFEFAQVKNKEEVEPKRSSRRFSKALKSALFDNSLVRSSTSILFFSVVNG